MVILPAPAPGWGRGAGPFLPPRISGPLPPSANTYFGSSLILLPVLSHLSVSSLPPTSWVLRAFSTLYFLPVELECVCQYFTYRNVFVGQGGGKCFTHLGK